MRKIQLTLHLLTVCVVSLLAASCASDVRVGKSFTPDQNTAVVYGRFKFTDNLKVGECRMVLKLANEVTQEPVLIRFSKTEPISCVRIAKGTYKVTGFTATDTSDKTLAGEQFGPADKIDVRFTAEPNTATYLGDYTGFVKFNVFGALTTFETGLTEATNNFPATTALFREEYPNLSSLTVRSGFDVPGK